MILPLSHISSNRIVGLFRYHSDPHRRLPRVTWPCVNRRGLVLHDGRSEDLKKGTPQDSPNPETLPSSHRFPPRVRYRARAGTALMTHLMMRSSRDPSRSIPSVQLQTPIASGDLRRFHPTARRLPSPACSFTLMHVGYGCRSPTPHVSGVGSTPFQVLRLVMFPSQARELVR